MKTAILITAAACLVFALAALATTLNRIGVIPRLRNRNADATTGKDQCKAIMLAMHGTDRTSEADPLVDAMQAPAAVAGNGVADADGPDGDPDMASVRKILESLKILGTGSPEADAFLRRPRGRRRERSL